MGKIAESVRREMDELAPLAGAALVIFAMATWGWLAALVVFAAFCLGWAPGGEA